jgi:DNA-binding NarL/FixJ family response regulator
MHPRIIIADDHQIVRQGLKRLLDSENDFTVVGEAPDGRSAVAMVRDKNADVVVMDVTMPDLNGIEAARQIARDFPNVKVVGLSMHADVRFATEMLRAGAKGYLLKDDAFEDLANAIRTTLDNRVYLSPKISDTVMAAYAVGDRPGEPSAFDRLSPREREVLQLMSEGRATKEIAHDLGVSIKTIETHRRQVMEKLKLYSVAELTKYAVREGLTSIER